MLGKLITLATSAKKIKVEKITREVFKEGAVKEFTVTLQQNQMYDFGVDSSGKSLGDYSATSVNKFGKRPGHIQMYETGKFYASIKVKTAKDGVIIEANTIKQDFDGAQDLLDRWPFLLGLNEKSLSKARTFAFPFYKEKTIEALRG